MESSFPRKPIRAGRSRRLFGGGIEAVCDRRIGRGITGHLRRGQLDNPTIHSENCGKSLAGIRFLGAGHLLGRALSNDAASGFAAFRTKIDNPIGLLNYVEMVLDDEHGIAKVDEAIEDVKELFYVVKMQASGGLVQDIKSAAGLTPR